MQKKRLEAMDSCIKVIAGSNDVKQQEALFFDRIREIHPPLKINYFWKLLSSLVQDIVTLEAFDSKNSRQRRENGRKYKIVEKLVQKLCGSGSENTRSNLKIKTDFLVSRFPKCFELT